LPLIARVAPMAFDAILEEALDAVCFSNILLFLVFTCLEKRIALMSDWNTTKMWDHNLIVKNSQSDRFIVYICSLLCCVTYPTVPARVRRRIFFESHDSTAAHFPFSENPNSSYWYGHSHQPEWDDKTSMVQQFCIFCILSTNFKK
jgi:hypothetical protein